MRNFVKVLLVGTVLAGACVLLPNDSWAKVIRIRSKSQGLTIDMDTETGYGTDQYGRRYLLTAAHKIRGLFTSKGGFVLTRELTEVEKLDENMRPWITIEDGSIPNFDDFHLLQDAAAKGEDIISSVKIVDYGIEVRNNGFGEIFFLEGQRYSSFNDALNAVKGVQPVGDSTTVIGKMSVTMSGESKIADVLQNRSVVLDGQLVGIYDPKTRRVIPKHLAVSFDSEPQVNYTGKNNLTSFSGAPQIGDVINGRTLELLPGGDCGWRDKKGHVYRTPDSSTLVYKKNAYNQDTSIYADMVDTSINGTYKLTTSAGESIVEVVNGVVIGGDKQPVMYMNADGYFVRADGRQETIISNIQNLKITDSSGNTIAVEIRENHKTGLNEIVYEGTVLGVYSDSGQNAGKEKELIQLMVERSLEVVDENNSQQPTTDTTVVETEELTQPVKEEESEVGELVEEVDEQQEEAGDTTEKPAGRFTREEIEHHRQYIEGRVNTSSPVVVPEMSVRTLRAFLTKENASVLTFDLLFGEGKGPKFVDDLSGQGGSGKWDVSDAQNAKLESVYGITLGENGEVTAKVKVLARPDDHWGGETVENKLGKGIVDLMNEMTLANNGEGYHSLLETHAGNSVALRDANAAVSAAEAKVAKMSQKHAENKTDAKADADYIAAVDQLREAREKQKAAQENYDKTEAGLKVIQDLAKANYGHAMDQALDTAKSTFGEAGAAYYTAYEKAIKAEDYEAAQLVLNKALADEVITEDQRQDLMDKTTAVEGTQAKRDAIEAEVNAAKMPVAAPIETDMTDLLRTAVVVAMPFVTETELALRADVNILAGDIGEAVAVVEDTALSDVDIDASMPSTVGGSATVVAELLKNAKVDLKLLDETFEEEKKTEIQIGGLASAGSQTGVSATLNTPQQEEKPEEEKKYLTDEQVNQIREKRQMLLKQYVNAAVQISEGMNAVSNKFADRANVLISFSEGVQNEASAFGLTQDVGRYVLLESLRAVALSSAQMGVQAARMLNEQEVDNEIK